MENFNDYSSNARLDRAKKRITSGLSGIVLNFSKQKYIPTAYEMQRAESLMNPQQMAESIKREKSIIYDKIENCISENPGIILELIQTYRDPAPHILFWAIDKITTPSGKLYISAQKEKIGNTTSRIRFWSEKRMPDHDGHFDTNASKLFDISLATELNIEHILKYMKNWVVIERLDIEDFPLCVHGRYSPTLYTLKRRDSDAKKYFHKTSYSACTE
jgi:hypothetical protein